MSSPYVTSENLIAVDIFVDISKPGYPRILNDQEIAALDQTKLPDHIKKETSHWRRPSWSIGTFIDSQAHIADAEGRQRWDITRYTIARIRALLVDWSLKSADQSLALDRQVRPDLPGVAVLTDAAMQVLGRVDDVIVGAFYARAMLAIYPVLEPPVAQKVEEPAQGN